MALYNSNLITTPVDSLYRCICMGDIYAIQKILDNDNICPKTICSVLQNICHLKYISSISIECIDIIYNHNIDTYNTHTLDMLLEIYFHSNHENYLDIIKDLISRGATISNRTMDWWNIRQEDKINIIFDFFPDQITKLGKYLINAIIYGKLSNDTVRKILMHVSPDKMDYFKFPDNFFLEYYHYNYTLSAKDISEIIISSVYLSLDKVKKIAEVADLSKYCISFAHLAFCRYDEMHDSINDIIHYILDYFTNDELNYAFILCILQNVGVRNSFIQKQFFDKLKLYYTSVSQHFFDKITMSDSQILYLLLSCSDMNTICITCVTYIINNCLKTNTNFGSIIHGLKYYIGNNPDCCLIYNKITLTTYGNIIETNDHLLESISKNLDLCEELLQYDYISDMIRNR